jgi:hypothetical protein
VVVEVTFGVVAYNELAEFHEKVHLGIFWAIQRHYGNDIANTTVIDLIQQGVTMNNHLNLSIIQI